MSAIPFSILAAKPKTFETVITPKIAEALLATIERQRPLKQGVAERYGLEMKQGHWRLTNGGIGIDKNGHLIDGQHRLWGCIDAEANFPTLVTIGLDVEAREVIDTGLSRSIADTIALRTGERVSPLMVGAAKLMMSPNHPNGCLRSDVMDFVVRHSAALEFALSCSTTKIAKVTTAPLLAVIARAYYTQDRDELKRFVSVLVSGMPEGDNYEPAIVLRNIMLTKTFATRSEIYWKVETALDHFLRGKKITRVYEAKGEIFPLSRAR